MSHLTGTSVEEAIDEIAANDDLCLGFVEGGSSGEPGTVIDQRPIAGKDLSTGSGDWEVQLTVATGLPRERAKQLVRAILQGPLCEGARAHLLDLS
jgi:beta-lactam-binding protein with PASTA domain